MKEVKSNHGENSEITKYTSKQGYKRDFLCTDGAYKKLSFVCTVCTYSVLEKAAHFSAKTIYT